MLIIAACGVTGTAHAHPTGAPLWGPTGLGTTPTAETVPAGTTEVGAGYEQIRPAFGRVRFAPVLTATHGFGKAEIGAGYLRERLTAPGFAQNTNYFALHGKYRLYENARGGSLALGAHYLDFGSAGGALTTLYAAGTQGFLRGPDGAARARAHLGLMYHRSSGTPASVREFRPMLGLEYDVARGFSVAADYAARKNSVARTMSLAVRHQSPAGWGAQIGIGKLRRDTKFFVGATYRFGGDSSPRPTSGTGIPDTRAIMPDKRPGPTQEGAG